MERQLSDEDEFAEAQRHDSAASWRLYLTSHPSGMHKREATERLEALEDEAYKRVLASKSESEAAQFLLQFPDTPRYRELQRLQAKWGEAKAIQHAIAALDRSDLPDAESWVAKVTDRARRADLERALASLREKDEWDKADAAGSASLLQGYVDRWPEGRWVAQAKKRLVKARADLREHEGRDFDAAWEKGTTAAWDEFLSKHTDSSRLAEAKSCRQEAAEFEQASGADTPKIWRAFMKAWPEGRHRLDAEVRLRAVARAR